jgi:transposase
VKTPFFEGQGREPWYDCARLQAGAGMTRLIVGRSRNQATLFPELLDEAIEADNPVRVVDAFFDALDLVEIGFDAEPGLTGRPGYPPATMLKVYLYGYLSQIQSWRRLERERQRNVRVMWLVGQLAPDLKTIADVRRDNGSAVRKVCARFVALCRGIHLLEGNAVAIDGSKFKAVNHREENFTKDRLAKRIAAVDSTVDRYLKELDRADRQNEVTGVPVPAAKVARLTQDIEKLKSKLGRLSAIEANMLATGETQISQTDPDTQVTCKEVGARMHDAQKQAPQKYWGTLRPLRAPSEAGVKLQ